MRQLVRYIKADVMKTRRLGVRGAHGLVPAGTAAVFLTYYAFAPWNPVSKLEAYFQVLGVALPILLGVFSAIAAEQETASGVLQNMLSVPCRAVSFISKLLQLLVFEAAAIFMASGMFGAGNICLLGRTEAGFWVYWKAGMVLFVSSISLYTWHLFLSLRFGKGISVGLGIVESLVSALLLTGLGTYIWMYVPCAWISMFPGLYLQKYLGILDPLSAVRGKTAAAVCVGFTILSLLAGVLWFSRWDGRKIND